MEIPGEALVAKWKMKFVLDRRGLKRGGSAKEPAPTLRKEDAVFEAAFAELGR